MLLKILWITATATSLLSCKPDVPKEPDTHDCSVIVHKDETGAYDWDEAYVFCVLRREPNNPAFHERYPLFPFLVGVLNAQEGMHPVLVKGKDYFLRAQWENDIKKWALENCKQNLKEE